MKLLSIDQAKVEEYIGEKNYSDLLHSINSFLDDVNHIYGRYFILMENEDIIACYVLCSPENYLFYIILNQHILKNIENFIIDFIETKDTKRVNIPVLKSDIATQLLLEDRGYKIECNKDCYLIYNKQLVGQIKNDLLKINLNKRNVLILTNNRNGLELYNRLKDIGENPILFSRRINKEAIEEVNIEYVISYNYSYIITDDVINAMGDKIINMHISLLPWNRGASPNFWSFIDNTPKGVTIHKIDSGLDTGEILFQKKIEFNEHKETFMTSYQILNKEIVNLLVENWENLKEKNYQIKKYNIKGTYHSIKDFKQFTDNFPVDWNETIYNFKKKCNIL